MSDLTPAIVTPPATSSDWFTEAKDVLTEGVGRWNDAKAKRNGQLGKFFYEAAIYCTKAQYAELEGIAVAGFSVGREQLTRFRTTYQREKELPAPTPQSKRRELEQMKRPVVARPRDNVQVPVEGSGASIAPESPQGPPPAGNEGRAEQSFAGAAPLPSPQESPGPADAVPGEGAPGADSGMSGGAESHPLRPPLATHQAETYSARDLRLHIEHDHDKPNRGLDFAALLKLHDEAHASAPSPEVELSGDDDPQSPVAPPSTSGRSRPVGTPTRSAAPVDRPAGDTFDRSLADVAGTPERRWQNADDLTLRIVAKKANAQIAKRDALAKPAANGSLHRAEVQNFAKGGKR